MSRLLHLYLDSTSGTVTLPHNINATMMTLKTYRIRHTLTNDAKANKIIDFNADWINSAASQLGSNTTATQAQIGLPLMVDNVQIFIRDCNMSFQLCKPIPNQFNYTLHGFTDTGFLNCSLVFEYQI